MNTISHENMTAHFNAGRATPWTQPLGAEQHVPVMARLDGTWYVVPDGHTDYHPAPPDLAADLTRIETVLVAADRAIADIGAEPLPEPPDQHSSRVCPCTATRSEGYSQPQLALLQSHDLPQQHGCTEADPPGNTDHDLGTA